MQTSQALICVAVLVIVGFCGVTTSIKCYVCDSQTSTFCGTTLFGAPISGAQQEGCTCCERRNDNGVTRRECITGLSSVSCVGGNENKKICYDDLCNDGVKADGKSFLLLTAIGALLPAIQYLREYLM